MSAESRPGDWVGLFRKNAVLIVGLLAIAASITGIRNGFALDDVHIIVENDRVQSLGNSWKLFGQTYWPPAEGASLYRPMTMLAFSIEWAIGGGSPVPFHAANILLYTLGCVALFRLLRLIAGVDVALLGAALFAVHPVHTEAVANVVGQAELLVALTVFLAVEHYIRARREGAVTGRAIAVIASLYLVGCLSKEHAVILPGLLLAAEAVIQREDETWRAKVRKALPLFAALFSIAIAFIVVRTLVTGGFRAAGHNELFGDQPYGSRVYTMLNVVVEWLRLLVWPAQLSADYSFPRTRVATGFELGMLPALAVLAGTAGLALHVRRTAPLVTFALAWMAVTLAIPSNLVMVTGFVLAERSLFLASAGVAMIASFAIIQLWKIGAESEPVLRRATVAAVGLLLALGISRAAIRNHAWHDNETLFRQTVEDVPLSSRAHWMLAEHLTQSGRAAEGVDEMLLAVALGRKNDPVLIGFGADQLQAAGLCGRAMSLYDRALALTPLNDQLRVNAALCLMKLGRIDQGRTLAQLGMRKSGASPQLDSIVAMADSLSAIRRK